MELETFALSSDSKGDLREFLKPALLKKLIAIKDSFVQRSFYKMLSSFAKSFPGRK
jgi:hypothetical protein